MGGISLIITAILLFIYTEIDTNRWINKKNGQN